MHCIWFPQFIIYRLGIHRTANREGFVQWTCVPMSNIVNRTFESYRRSCSVQGSFGITLQMAREYCRVLWEPVSFGTLGYEYIEHNISNIRRPLNSSYFFVFYLFFKIYIHSKSHACGILRGLLWRNYVIYT